MKKIKLVVSDLHLGTGKTLENGSLNSLEEFYFDERFSEFLNYYSTGEHAQSEKELILNGDIFNFLQVDFEGHFLTVITEQISLAKMRAIVDGHKVFFDALREFAANPLHSISYVIGNHDQEMMWPSVRSFLNEVVGESVRYNNIEYFFDGIYISHGHMFEAANRFDSKKFFLRKNVPEPVLNLPFGSVFFVNFVLKIKQLNPNIDKVRPFKAFVRWGLINDTLFTMKTILGLIWFFVTTTVKGDQKRHWNWRTTLGIFREAAIFPDLAQSARRILTHNRINTVIFGHSHVYSYKKWGVDKEYFNTGTWTELTSLDVASLGKITKLTYVLIEYPEETVRPRCRLKQWRGYHRVEEDVDVA
ncbi:MAG: metallophosphoesterase [Bdellovibrionales bacterium]|nr:metallophosphoesterase [Bdellovibrionales bacterium]